MAHWHTTDLVNKASHVHTSEADLLRYLAATGKEAMRIRPCSDPTCGVPRQTNHWQIVKQPNLVGHNLDGSEQETGEFYVLLMNGVPVYDHDGFFQVLTVLMNVGVTEGDRISLDVEV